MPQGTADSPTMQADRPAVLIVDDRKENLVALRQVLAGLDVEVVEATSGNAALAATLDWRFAVAVVDVQMPGMDGYEFATLLHGDAKTRLVPVIFVTGNNADEQHLFRGYEAGAVDYIVKPCQPEVLQAKVRVFLELDRAREELRRHRDELETLVAERTAEVRQGMEEIRRAARNWQSTFDAMHDAVSLLDRDLKIVRCNRAMCGLAGRPLDQITGQHCCKLLHEKASPPPECAASRAAKSLRRETWQSEFGDRWFDISVDPVLDEHGTLTGFTHVMTDITERKRAEEELRAAHEQLRQFVDSNIVGIVIAAADGRILEANGYYLDIIGYTHEELSRGEVDWRAITPPEWLPADERALAELHERGTCTPYEKEYVRRDGTRVAVYLADAILPGPGERIAAFAADITARKQAERDLALVNRRLEELIEAVQALSNARYIDGVAAVVRSFARRLTGADGASFVLREGDMCHYVDEDAIGPLWKGQRFPLESCVSGWAMVHRESVVIPDILRDSRIPAGAYSPTFVKSLAMVPIRTDDPIGAIGVYWAKFYHANEREVRLIQTLADASANAIQIVRLLQELEARVASRTSELTAANRELEAFSYSVSHDLRAPLRVISGFSQMLIEDYGAALDPEARRLLDLVRENTRRMSTLIDDLLTLSRVGRTEIRISQIAMAPLVASVLAEVLANEDRQRFAVDIGGLPDAMGDAGLIRQVWTNLLSNAVKFSHKREKPRIAISSTSEGRMVAYHVEDNGAGFDMAHAGKLFGVFQRLHSASDFPGTGVGLALVNRIVTRHGGTASAKGKAGEGARFSFTLPQARAESARPGGLLEKGAIR